MKIGVKNEDGIKGHNMFSFRATHQRCFFRKMISESETGEKNGTRCRLKKYQHIGGN